MVKKIIIISFLLGFLFFFLYEDKKEGLEIIFFDQTTPNMIQRISGIFERNPLISKEL